MAKKIKRKGAKRETPSSPPLPNPMAMEATLANLHRIMGEQKFASVEEAQVFLDRLLAEGSGHLPAFKPHSPKELAQELVYQAWDAPTEQKAAALARQALAISPDCADAYNILAETEGTSPEETCDLYRKGVEAGTRDLGEDFFAANKGHFWGMVETRPYMRARLGLSHYLWAMGREEESIKHCEALLDLNPNDNQGVRDILLSRYLALGNDVGAARLYRDYPDEWSAAFLWSRVLLDLRRGDPAAAKTSMKVAKKCNPHVPAFFTGKSKLPAGLPETYSPGDRDEAVLYVAAFAQAWIASPGAMEWLISQLAD